MGRRPASSWGRRNGASGCSAGQHKPSRAAVDTGGTVDTTHCTRCGCRLVKDPVTRAWYISGLLG